MEVSTSDGQQQGWCFRVHIVGLEIQTKDEINKVRSICAVQAGLWESLG